ncbi:LLM class flavin-dependent oxidoreductase [Spirillospora sp. NBC_01491]|uniref:LLM class flavin-dependent oxidoreductase n=1 Tax=Spirillospora sp. NBC_01491 TaxID=2976007 RepID=UPI002E2F1D01|nr:LLM class flavin-dependent oxidoreductase [Spirillospora sp. NBC_01491]
MTDYGRPPRFGLFLAPDASAPLIRTAQEADRLGLDLIGVQDHPYQRRFVDMPTLMGALLAATSRVRVFPAVACLPLRPPATLAKAMASMDRLSDGRVELGLGAGAFWDAIEAYGGARLAPGAARAALEEAVQVIRMLWSDQRGLRFDGAHYRLAGAQPGPPPAHKIGIWLGVTGPRSLELAGRVADGWIVSSSHVPPQKLLEGQRRVDDSAAEAGRDPAEIRRLYNLAGSIDESGSQGFLNGPVRQWADQLTELAVTYGVDTFVFAGDPDQLGAFAMEVAPAVREQVARERAG